MCKSNQIVELLLIIITLMIPVTVIYLLEILSLAIMSIFTFQYCRLSEFPTIAASSPDEDLIVIQKLGGSLTLTCNGSALPPPIVVWYHNGEVTSTGKSFLSFGNDIKVDGGTLQISKLSSSHFGIFQCSVITNHNDRYHVAHRIWFIRIIGKSLGKN